MRLLRGERRGMATTEKMKRWTYAADIDIGPGIGMYSRPSYMRSWGWGLPRTPGTGDIISYGEYSCGWAGGSVRDETPAQCV